MRTRFLMFVPAILAATSSLTAPAAAQDCGEVLRQGLYDELSITSKEDLKSQLNSIFAMSYEQLKQEAKSGKGGLSASIAGLIEAKGEGGGDESAFNSMKKQFFSSFDSFIASSSFLELSKRTVNESVIRAWRDCNDQRRIIGWLKGDPASEVVLTVRYIPRSSTDPDFVEISDVATTNLVVVGDSLKGVKLNKFTSGFLKLKRTDARAATVQIGVKGQDGVFVELGLIEERVSTNRVHEIPIVFSINTLGTYQRISGGDDEMDIDHNDAVPVSFEGRLFIEGQQVKLHTKFWTREDGGNGTRIGGERVFNVAAIPAGAVTPSIVARGGNTFALAFSYRGASRKEDRWRPQSFPRNQVDSSFWRELRCILDGNGKNDHEVVGVTGTLNATLRYETTQVEIRRKRIGN